MNKRKKPQPRIHTDPIFQAETRAQVFEQKLGIPTRDWVGQCYGIACLLVEKKLVEGHAVYGSFYGYVDPDSPLYRPNVPFYRHGWILVKGGNVCDPTRWVFENTDPYIFEGNPGVLYDEGASDVKRAFRIPPPAFNPEEELKDLKASKALVDHLKGLIAPEKGLSQKQLFWLANTPYVDHGHHVIEFYPLLARRGDLIWIPQDDATRFKREHGIDLHDLEPTTFKRRKK